MSPAAPIEGPEKNIPGPDKVNQNTGPKLGEMPDAEAVQVPTPSDRRRFNKNNRANASNDDKGRKVNQGNVATGADQKELKPVNNPDKHAKSPFNQENVPSVRDILEAQIQRFEKQLAENPSPDIANMLIGTIKALRQYLDGNQRIQNELKAGVYNQKDARKPKQPQVNLNKVREDENRQAIGAKEVKAAKTQNKKDRPQKGTPTRFTVGPDGQGMVDNTTSQKTVEKKPKLQKNQKGAQKNERRAGSKSPFTVNIPQTEAGGSSDGGKNNGERAIVASPNSERAIVKKESSSRTIEGAAREIKEIKSAKIEISPAQKAAEAKLAAERAFQLRVKEINDSDRGLINKFVAKAALNFFKAGRINVDRYRAEKLLAGEQVNEKIKNGLFGSSDKTLLDAVLDTTGGDPKRAENINVNLDAYRKEVQEHVRKADILKVNLAAGRGEGIGYKKVEGTEKVDKQITDLANQYVEASGDPDKIADLRQRIFQEYKDKGLPLAEAQLVIESLDKFDQKSQVVEIKIAQALTETALNGSKVFKEKDPTKKENATLTKLKDSLTLVLGGVGIPTGAAVFASGFLAEYLKNSAIRKTITVGAIAGFTVATGGTGAAVIAAGAAALAGGWMGMGKQGESLKGGYLSGIRNLERSGEFAGVGNPKLAEIAKGENYTNVLKGILEDSNLSASQKAAAIKAYMAFDGRGLSFGKDDNEFNILQELIGNIKTDKDNLKAELLAGVKKMEANPDGVHYLQKQLLFEKISDLFGKPSQEDLAAAVEKLQDKYLAQDKEAKKVINEYALRAGLLGVVFGGTISGAIMAGNFGLSNELRLSEMFTHKPSATGEIVSTHEVFEKPPLATIKIIGEVHDANHVSTFEGLKETPTGEKVSTGTTNFTRENTEIWLRELRTEDVKNDFANGKMDSFMNAKTPNGNFSRGDIYAYLDEQGRTTAIDIVQKYGGYDNFVQNPYAVQEFDHVIDQFDKANFKPSVNEYIIQSGDTFWNIMNNHYKYNPNNPGSALDAYNKIFKNTPDFANHLSDFPEPNGDVSLQEYINQNPTVADRLGHITAGAKFVKVESFGESTVRPGGWDAFKNSGYFKNTPNFNVDRLREFMGKNFATAPGMTPNSPNALEVFLQREATHNVNTFNQFFNITNAKDILPNSGNFDRVLPDGQPVSDTLTDGSVNQYADPMIRASLVKVNGQGVSWVTTNDHSTPITIDGHTFQPGETNMSMTARKFYADGIHKMFPGVEVDMEKSFKADLADRIQNIPGYGQFPDAPKAVGNHFNIVYKNVTPQVEAVVEPTIEPEDNNVLPIAVAAPVTPYTYGYDKKKDDNERVSQASNSPLEEAAFAQAALPIPASIGDEKNEVKAEDIKIPVAALNPGIPFTVTLNNAQPVSVTQGQSEPLQLEAPKVFGSLPAAGGSSFSQMNNNQTQQPVQTAEQPTFVNDLLNDENKLMATIQYNRINDILKIEDLIDDRIDFIRFRDELLTADNASFSNLDKRINAALLKRGLRLLDAQNKANAEAAPIEENKSKQPDLANRVVSADEDLKDILNSQTSKQNDKLLQPV